MFVKWNTEDERNDKRSELRYRAFVTKHFSTSCSIFHMIMSAKALILVKEYEPSSRQAHKEKSVILVL